MPVDLEKHVTEEFTIHSEDEGAETTTEPKPVDKPQPQEPDYWVQRGMFLVRVHRTARKKLFSPTEASDAPPMEISEIDVVRITKTNSDMVDERNIDDVWSEGLPNRELSQE